MKKKTLLIVSTSFALGVGVIGSGVGALLHQKASAPGVMEDATLPSDEIGARVRLGAEGDATTEPTVAAPTFVNTLGYRLIDEESGAKSIRVYAVLDGYKGLNSASVTRKVEDSTGASVMKEKTIEFGYVYSSIKDAESVTWDDALPAETDTTKNYYVVFTLKNIPEAHWLDKLSVTFAIDNGAIVKSAEALANVKGLMEQEVGIGIKLAKAANGVIFAMCKDKSITEAVIPENYYTYEGHVATFVGKVTRLGDPAVPNTGVFEGCTSLTSVSVPDTITEMGGSTFYNAGKVTTFTMPRDLTTVHSSVWSRNSLKTLYWNSINFVNEVGATFDGSLDEIIISDKVQSLPKKFLYVSATVKKIVFKGTTAQWEALKNDANKDNGLFTDSVITSDNSYVVTYHLPEGVTLNGQTGKVKAEFLKGKVVDYGIALKDGMKFEGWYTDAALSTPLDTTTPATANLDLYPKFVEFGPGISEAKPIVLGEENKTYTETLVPGYEDVYFKYTAPADAVAGWRYVRINEKASTTNKDLSVGVTEFDRAKLFFYKDSVSTANLLSETSTATPNDKGTVQQIDSSSTFKRIWVEPGQTYFIVADAYNYSFYPDNHWYGDMVIEWSKGVNDTFETAAEIVLGQEQDIKPEFTKQPLPLRKYSPTVTKDVALYITNYQNFLASVTCYDVTGDSVKNVGNLRANYSYDNSVPVGETIKILTLEAGHTYVFYSTSNAAATDEKYATFRLDNPPVGTSMSDPVAYTLGTEVDVKQVGDSGVFYSFTLEAETTIKVSANGGNSSYDKYLKLLSTDGSVVADAGKEVGEKGNYDYWSGDYEIDYGVNPLEINIKLPAGTYILNTGYVSSTATRDSFKLTSKIMLPGDTISDPLTVEVNTEGVATLNATSAGTFYQITATQAGFIKFDVTTAGNGKLYLIDSTGKTISSAKNGESFYKSVSIGDTLLFKAGDAADTLTVAVSYVTEIHDGKSQETAYDLDFSAGETVNVKYATGDTYAYGVYFKFTVNQTGTYRLYTNNASVDTRAVAVYEGLGNTQVNGTFNGDDNGAHVPYTQHKNDTYNELPLEAGKTYYLSMNFDSNKTGVDVLLGLSLLGEGDMVSSPIAKSWAENSMTVTGNIGTKFYSFTETTTGTYDISLSSSVEDAAPVVTIYENGKEVTGQGTQKNRYDFEAGKTYVIKVFTNATADVTITRTVHVGAFTGSPAIGQYIGAKNGGSWYKVIVTSDTVAFEWHAAAEPKSSPVTTNGITSFSDSERDYYTNGTDMVAKEGDGFYFLSKRQTTYKGDAVNGQMGKTSGATWTSGVVIQSIEIDGGSRIYSVIKDGTIYFGATVELAEGETGGIGGSIKPFTVKDASGTVIGAYSSNNGTLTEVTSPAA